MIAFRAHKAHKQMRLALYGICCRKDRSWRYGRAHPNIESRAAARRGSSSCRVAEGFGPDDATTTGPAFHGRQVPSPARYAGDM